MPMLVSAAGAWARVAYLGMGCQCGERIRMGTLRVCAATESPRATRVPALARPQDGAGSAAAWAPAPQCCSAWSLSGVD